MWRWNEERGCDGGRGIKKKTMTEETGNNCRDRGELGSFFLSPQPENPFLCPTKINYLPYSKNETRLNKDSAPHSLTRLELLAPDATPFAHEFVRRLGQTSTKEYLLVWRGRNKWFALRSKARNFTYYHIWLKRDLKQ